MAPEVYLPGTKYGEAADVFSTCATIFELANLQPAYSGTSAEIMAKMLMQKADHEQFAEICPKDLRPIITRGLKLNPEDRPAMYVFVQDLEAIKLDNNFVVEQMTTDEKADSGDQPTTTSTASTEDASDYQLTKTVQVNGFLDFFVEFVNIVTLNPR